MSGLEAAIEPQTAPQDDPPSPPPDSHAGRGFPAGPWEGQAQQWERATHVDKGRILNQELRLCATAEEGGEERSEALHGYDRGRADLELIEQGLRATWRSG